jgi:hypothetical protein
MIGNLTVNDISALIVFLVGLIGGIGYLHKALKDWLEKLLDDKFKTLGTKISELEDKVDKVDMENCKNFLVRFLADVESGSLILDPEKQRFWEEYEHYVACGGNSYIKEWVEKLKKKGYL